MPHWKSMMDRDYIFAFDLNGKDVVVTIARVVAGELVGQGGRKSKKPVIFFEGKEKGLALNATNSKTIAAMYGNYTEKWIGKRITIYPTTTQMGGETMECIRVRPTQPNGARASNGPGKKQEEPHQPDASDSGETELTDDEKAEIARQEAASNG